MQESLDRLSGVSLLEAEMAKVPAPLLILVSQLLLLLRLSQASLLLLIAVRAAKASSASHCLATPATKHFLNARQLEP